ncbi:MAG: 5,10-methylenetetrahydrofolate reductase, partial [Actinobacteria bacterium]|nr:5,10-methylenetetrahydrofolate reductase [Actinomycetota bacterium]
ITCRDRNRLALQSDLLSAFVLNIRNLLVLTGDHTNVGDTKHAKPVFDLDSVQLLQVIKILEGGYDMVGNPLKGKPDFFKGAAINPEVSNGSLELQLIKMKKKVEMGAQFFQTMPVFNPDKFKIFMERVKHIGINIPIIAGIQLIKSERMADYMNKYIPGIHIPDWIIDKMTNSKNKAETGISIAADILNEIKSICAGVHIGAQGWEKYLPVFLKNFETPKPGLLQDQVQPDISF